MNVLVYVDIDQGIPQGKDVKLHEMNIKQHGFTYTNIANY